MLAAPAYDRFCKCACVGNSFRHVRCVEDRLADAFCRMQCFAQAQTYLTPTSGDCGSVDALLLVILESGTTELAGLDTCVFGSDLLTFGAPGQYV